MENTKKLQHDEVILKFDSLCLDELIKVGEASLKQSASGLTPSDTKQCNQVFVEAIATFDELISTYQSDRLLQLKRRDSILNVQIIPNVDRIRLEKVLVARDIQARKE